MPKEQYMCQLCANHGIFNQPKKGHKQKCPHRLCPCPLCALNTKRRRLDQMERQLRTVGSSDEDGNNNNCSSSNNSSFVNSDGNLNTVFMPAGNEISGFPVTLFQPFNFQVKEEDEICSSPFQQRLPNTVERNRMKIGRKMGGKESHRNPSHHPYSVPIPATLGQHQLRNFKRPAPISPEIQAERKRRAELFEQTLARITANKKSSTTSIFHSVQMLAEPG